MKEKARKFYLPDFIIRHARGIELLFVLMTLCSLFLMPFVRVNYDLTKYLPESVASKEGLDLMEEAFGYPGTARVMISDVSLYEAKRCHRRGGYGHVVRYRHGYLRSLGLY